MDVYVYGIRVFNGGSLQVQEFYIYGNIRGVWIDEGLIGVLVNRVLIIGLEIYDNKYEGVVVGVVFEFIGFIIFVVIIWKNKIFYNGMFGICLVLSINDVFVEENVIFENYWWGVCVYIDFGGLYRYNEVCNNKMGGIMVSRWSLRKLFCVVENNYIYDNCGLVVYEGFCFVEKDLFLQEFCFFFMKVIKFIVYKVKVMQNDVFLFNSVLVVFKVNYCVGNDFGQKMFKVIDLIYCVFCL